jgi:hypothetical protein
MLNLQSRWLDEFGENFAQGLAQPVLVEMNTYITCTIEKKESQKFALLL